MGLVCRRRACRSVAQRGTARRALRALVARARYADFEDLWAPLPTGVGPSGAFCKSLDDERRAALHDAYRRGVSGSATARSSSQRARGRWPESSADELGPGRGRKSAWPRSSCSSTWSSCSR